MKIEVVKNRKIFLSISLMLVLTSLVLMGVFGFKQGIDFTGGSLWQIKFSEPGVMEQNLREAMLTAQVEGVSITRSSDNSWLLRFGEMDEARHQDLTFNIRQTVGNFEELSFQSIGPSIGQELRKKAIWAVFMVLLGVSLFVAFSFRKVSEPVSSFAYGGVTLIALFHDVIIPTGLLAVLGRVVGVELDTNFIVALLVIAGFSVHDTIVVFDRIRENLKREKGRPDLSLVVNKSVKETMARSINTSITLVFILIAMLLAGPQSLFYFILTILVGTIVGTYSSIFLASPMLVVWQERKERSR